MADRTETIRWETGSGKAVMVTVSLEREIRHLGTDEWTGEDQTKDMGLKVQIAAEVEGMGHMGDWLVRRSPRPGVAAVIGKLGITQDNLDRIDAAIARLKQSPEWQEQEARRAEHDAEMERYEEHTGRMRRAMRTQG